jgi:hypothetical protein
LFRRPAHVRRRAEGSRVDPADRPDGLRARMCLGAVRPDLGGFNRTNVEIAPVVLQFQCKISQRWLAIARGTGFGYLPQMHAVIGPMNRKCRFGKSDSTQTAKGQQIDSNAFTAINTVHICRSSSTTVHRMHVLIHGIGPPRSDLGAAPEFMNGFCSSGCVHTRGAEAW